MTDQYVNDQSELTPEDDVVNKHHKAMTLGKQNKDCKSSYPKCTTDFQTLWNVIT
jgi:hypothetical protein